MWFNHQSQGSLGSSQQKSLFPARTWDTILVSMARFTIIKLWKITIRTDINELYSYGKSPFFMGKFTINGDFQ